MIDVLRRAAPGEQVMVFGAHIVDADGVKRREQTFDREEYLAAARSVAPPAQLLVRSGADGGGTSSQPSSKLRCSIWTSAT